MAYQNNAELIKKAEVVWDVTTGAQTLFTPSKNIMPLTITANNFEEIVMDAGITDPFSADQYDLQLNAQSIVNLWMVPPTYPTGGTWGGDNTIGDIFRALVNGVGMLKPTQSLAIVSLSNNGHPAQSGKIKITLQYVEIP